jgi:hypothetical protein
MGAHIKNNAELQPLQHLLLTDGFPSTSTDLAAAETPIEHVEGIIDLSEELFPQIPDLPNGKEKRPRLTSKDLEAIRTIAIYYTRHAQQFDPLPGQISRLLTRILQ